MSRSPERSAAYHGKGWKARATDLASELAGRDSPWSRMRVDSEYRPLKAVLLFVPGDELRRIRDPDAAQHLRRIEPTAVARELRGLARVYRSLGIEVFFMRRSAFSGRRPPPNLMYARDLFLNTREGAVVARMSSLVRAGEEKYASLALARLAIPIGRTVCGSGVFEGADALWLDPNTVLCGLGRRTNSDGLRQLRELLKRQGVACVPVRMPSDVQHLLGLLQIVDRDLALIRVDKAPAALKRLLRGRGFRLVEIEETPEVTRNKGMNVVVVSPKTVVMPSDCPGLGRLYRGAGIEIAAEVPIRELLKGAGGIGCATGILAREVARDR